MISNIYFAWIKKVTFAKEMMMISVVHHL